MGVLESMQMSNGQAGSRPTGHESGITKNKPEHGEMND